ncbi:MAG: ABC transporter substrate-binding protein [Verrucomicrobiota bacterium]
MNRTWLAFVSLALAAGLLATCVAADAARSGGTLRLSSILDVDSVDPAIAYAPQSLMLEYATCANLYNYPDAPGAKGTTAAPEVATGSPQVSPDGKTQTIDLLHTYRFDSGARVTAANYVAAFNRDASPTLKSSAADVGYLNDVVGAEAVMAGKAQTISGVKALGPYRLQIRTTKPVPDLVSRLTMPFFCPIAVDTPPHEIDDPLGSGPYYIALRVPNRKVVLERNRFYKGGRPANVDHIVYTVGPGQEACRQAIEQDELDWCDFLADSDYRAIAAEYGINRPNGRFFFNPTLATGYFAFNHDRPAFKGRGQIPLMEAINWAIDRPALVRASGYLGGERTDQILPPAMGREASIYPSGGVDEKSLAAARALFAKAKFKPKTLVLYTATSPSFFAIWAQIFQFNMKRLGIDVQIRYFGSAGALFTAAGVRGAPFDVVTGRWTVDYADPSTYFDPLLNGDNITSTGNTNIAYFDRPEYNRTIERIDSLTGPGRRKAWADLDVEMMRDDPPWAPFLNGARADFVSRSFGCYVLQPVIGRPDIAAACKK